MSSIYKIEALIVLADKASEDLSELLGLAEKLGRIDILEPNLVEIKKYNLLAKLLNLLRETARTTSMVIKKNVSLEFTEPER